MPHEGRRSRCKKVIESYADNTTAHGIKKLTDKNGVVLKIAWLVLLLGARGMIFFQVYRLILLYYRRPVNTKSSTQITPLLFPGVTFCNLNPVLNSRASQNTIYGPVRKIATYLNIPLSTLQSENETYLQIDEDTLGELKYNSTDPLEEALQEFKLELQTLNEESLVEMSQTFRQFLVSCYFGGEQCDISNFTRTYSVDYGLCYTFPNKTTVPEGIRVHNSGPLFGLKLILNVDQKEYIPFITSSAGVRLQVHEFGTKPYLQEQGQSLSTGFETQIGVRPVLYKHLASPYGNCDNSGLYKSNTQCERLCIEGAIEDRCTCDRKLDDRHPILDYDDIIGPCTSTDIPCIKKVYKDKQRGKIVCKQCRSHCRIYAFEKQVSMTRWPAKQYDPAVMYLLRKWSELEEIDALTETESRDNLLALNVFYTELSLQTIEEKPAYEWENLVSDVGGQLGLWLGISVLSVCEVLELVCLLLASCCKPRTNVRPTKD